MADLAAVTRIDITATDSTGPALASATSGLEKFGATGAAIASQITNTFAAIGVALSVAGLVEFTKGIVDAAEQLHRMSLVTGSSVEDLSRLSNAAKITGVDFDTFRSMVDKMASNMETLNATSTRAQKALAFLGVTAKDPAQALQEVAEKLDQYADSAGKAAATRDIFGKGGAEMTAALHAMATAGNELITTTTADAEAAAKLAEQIRTLGVHMTTLKDAILREVVPAISTWITRTEDARAAGLGWWDSLKIGTTYADRLEPSIAAANVELVKLKKAFDDATNSGNAFARLNAMENLAPQIANQQTIIDQLRKAAGYNPATSANPQSVYGDAWSEKPILDWSTAVVAGKTALQSLTEALVDQYAKLTLTNAEYQIWQANLKGAKGRLDELIKTNIEIAERAKDFAERLKEQSKGFVDLEAATKKQNDAAGAYTDSLVKQNETLQLANDTFGMTATQVELYKLALDRAKESAAGNAYNVLLLDEAMQKLNDTIEKQGLAKAAKDAEEAFKKASTEIDRDLSTMFSNMLFKGKSAFEDLKNFAQDLFKKLVLQPILQPVANSLAGAFGGGAGGVNLGSGGGVGNLFSGLFGDLFGSFSGGAGSGIFGSLGASFSNLNLAITGGIGSIGGFGAALGALAPALGIIAAVAIPLLSGLFGKGGGPKVAGQAGLDYYTSESSAAKNSIVQATVDALGTSYTAMLAAFGGKGTATFGLGYDTDPQGTAQNRVSSLATVGGQNVYSTRDVNVGRDDATLQTALALEAQRVVLAALKASDLPADIAKLFSSIDVATASAADIAAIEKTAAVYKLINDTLSTLPADVQKHFTDMLDGTQKTADAVLVVTSIIRTFGDAIVGIGPKLEALDPASLNAFVDALGGAAAATAQFAYLGQNFLTTADRIAQSTKTLNVDFTNLGLTIPTTHKQFLDLLNSFDLTTEAGRSMYASVLALAPLFVTVHGTADQATTSINGVATALSNIAQSADAFFKANFYTSAEQAAKKHADEIKQIADASAALGVTIPTSVEGFRKLIEGIDTSTDAGKKLYEALIVLAPAVFDLSGAAATAATNVTDLANSINQNNNVGDILQQQVDTFVQQAAALADQLANADVGAKLALQISLVGKRIAEVTARIAYYNSIGQGAQADALTVQLAAYNTVNAQLTTSLAHFTILSAQYGSAMAGQLVDLEKWYADQRAVLKDNIPALDALTSIFNDKWAAIIAGTSNGVNNTIAALQKIADYLKSLQIGSLSPLTPLQQLSTASASFQADYLKAKGGDATALGNITGDASAYLTLARAAYASSQTYTDIFNRVTQQLASIAGTTVTGQPRTVTGDSAWPGLAAALPVNGARLVSTADIDRLIAAINENAAATADAGTEDAQAITNAITRNGVLVADATAPRK